VPDQYRDDGPDCDRRLAGKGFDPTDIELLPSQQRGSRPRELRLSTPNRDRQLVEVLGGRRSSDNSDRPVRERQVLRFAKEPVDVVTSRTSS
jgi:hypothetical protein